MEKNTAHMNHPDLKTLVASRLEDMADQFEFLVSKGDYARADVVRKEGLHLAEHYDNELTFLYINDFTGV